jgi:hypothetical protein
MDDIVKITQAIASVAQALAIVVGGAWVYFKFLRGRTFARRAELDLEATLAVVSDKPLIKAKASLRNTGLSRLPLKPDFKWIELAATTASPAMEGANVAWDSIMSSDVFVKHAWVEAQETIDDEVLFPVPAAPDDSWRAFRLAMEIWGAPTVVRRRSTRWTDSTIVLAHTDE